ncbi:phage tail protein [Bradyrhizobium sp. vgs-9]|uniref:phage tail protein n=1 Tax=Bradyrhizobium TaxID=374 RepID=UPI003392AA8C
MATGVTSWSQSAATNASADTTVNWQEGQSPSSVNDSARAMMASVAKYRDDTAGALITGGTSTAYTLTSNQGFASKSAMNGVEISFTVSATNGANPTLNVDGLGADPITLDGTVPVPTGTLIAGSIYTAMYYNAGTAWRLKDFYQLPFVVPIGAVVDYFGTTAPSGNFVFPTGQAISRTTYSALFALFGTTFGTGDGSTTFNVPDLTGRVVAMKEASATRLTSSYFGGNSTTLGATGGAESLTLTAGQLPSNIPYTDPGHFHTTTITSATSTSAGGFPYYGSINGTGVAYNSDGKTTGIAINPSGGNAHRTVQPTIIANKLLRII